MLRKLGLAIGFIGWLVCCNAQADDVLLEEFYGNGVHAYYQGDFTGAHSALSAAINGGTKDPRAFYFRGLAYLQLGRSQEAQADFQKGAELEVKDSSDFYPVSRSLERVQGRSRQMLEQYRAVVHATAIQKREAERQARYEERAAAEEDVLRRVKPIQLPSSSAAQPKATMNPESGAAGGDVNPFAKPAAEEAAPAAEAPVNNSMDKAAPEDKNPFEAEPAKPEPKPAPATPEAKPAPATNDNPFGDAPPSAAPAAKSSMSANAPVQPTAGGVGSLMKAVTKGLQGKPSAAANNPQMPEFLKGIMGSGQTTPAGAPANPGAGAAAPAQEMPAATPPAAMPGAPPQGSPAEQANPTTPPQGAPAEQAKPTTPPQSNPGEQPKPADDNPFN
jgi:hypothetical protein